MPQLPSHRNTEPVDTTYHEVLKPIRVLDGQVVDHVMPGALAGEPPLVFTCNLVRCSSWQDMDQAAQQILADGQTLRAEDLGGGAYTSQANQV